MKLTFRRFDLQLRHQWTIGRDLVQGEQGIDIFPVVFVELVDRDGLTGIGEAAPSVRYGERPDDAVKFFQKVSPDQLSFADLNGSFTYINALSPKDFAAKGALNIALQDGAARHLGKPIYDALGLGFTEKKHVTSFSIGIDRPEMIREKVLAAAPYPILKLKVGSPQDKQNLAALREVAPKKKIRVDANESWKTKEEALRQIEELAKDKLIEFVEQPMPAATPMADWRWLRERSPLALMADESYPSAKEISKCTEWAHAVNVKLVKAGGITGAYEALRAARQAGLKTMIGCMIESSLLISAAAHLAELSDYLDLDGNILIKNDPYQGVSTKEGVMSFADAPEPTGLRVRNRGKL